MDRIHTATRRHLEPEYTLREITEVCRRFNQDTVIVIIHHGRTGRQKIAQTIKEGVCKVQEIHTQLGGPDAGSRRSLERILAKGKTEGYFCTGKSSYKLNPKGQAIDP